MPFEFKRLGLEGLVAVEPRRFADERGWFCETYKASDFSAFGITEAFRQDNHSLSARGVLRGLHYQNSPHAQGKLVRVVRGKAWDVAVDIRPGSATFGKWAAAELSAENGRMLYLPPGFAHGFLSMSDGTELVYKCTAEYDPASDAGLRWDDPDLSIAWPLRDVAVSAKDATLPYFKDLARKGFTHD